MDYLPHVSRINFVLFYQGSTSVYILFHLQATGRSLCPRFELCTSTRQLQNNVQCDDDVVISTSHHESYHPVIPLYQGRRKPWKRSITHPARPVLKTTSPATEDGQPKEYPFILVPSSRTMCAVCAYRNRCVNLSRIQNIKHNQLKKKSKITICKCVK